jgi:hypothetical protein
MVRAAAAILDAAVSASCAGLLLASCVNATALEPDELFQKVSPSIAGSSGGGLFDRDGNLIGITTAGGGPEAQNITIAHPVEWVREVPERGKAALARRQGGTAVTATAPASSSRRPEPVFEVGGRIEQPDVRVGDRWRYQVTDLFTNLRTAVTMEVITVTNDQIHTRSAQSALAALNPTSAGGFVDVWDRSWNMLRSNEPQERSYHPSPRFPLESGKRWTAEIAVAPQPGVTLKYEVVAQVSGWERVTVPAGTYDAVRISMTGRFSASGADIGVGTIDDILWYAPAIRQFVRKQIKQLAEFSRGATGAYNNQRHERWELVEYKPN